MKHASELATQARVSATSHSEEVNSSAGDRSPEVAPTNSDRAASDELSKSFTFLGIGGAIAISSALLTRLITHFSHLDGQLPFMVDLLQLLLIGAAGATSLRWAHRRMRRARARAEELWLKRQEELYEAARRDDLTELHNRRFFNEQLQAELDKASRRRTLFSVLTMDVDDLKVINDEFGHQVGDLVLQRLATLLNELAGGNCVVARLGGDEFGVLMPGADRRQADDLSWRIWDQLATSPAYETAYASVYLGISIGAAGYPWAGTTGEEIIHWADVNLYTNKMARKTPANDAEADASRPRLASAVIEVLLTALDARDKMTHRHSRRVARLSVLVAGEMGLPEKEVADIQYAAALHDIGKIGVPDEILRKTSSLDDEEWKEMRRHSQIGYEILKSIDFLQDAAEIVHAHHEVYDGSGYPRGLSGNEIPIGARLFSIVDAYDAMTSRRPYRDATTQERAMVEIGRNAGKQFDPKAVKAFLAAIRRYPDGFGQDSTNTDDRTVAAARTSSPASGRAKTGDSARPSALSR